MTKSLLVLAGLLLASVAQAQPADSADLASEPSGAPSISLDVSEGVRDEAAAGQPAESAAAAASKGRPKYGVPSGHDWISIFAGYADDFDQDQDYNLTVAWSTFIAKELEFAVEGGGWYFDQVGENTGGVSAIIDFRWHFLHDDEFTWSVYGDVGIGLLAGFDEVPDGGTGFNFMPRAGVGFTHELGDDGTRLQLGVRWHHISNGRIEGDERNPGRDSIMVYAGVIFPF